MSRWWYLAAPALPLLLPQALWVRRTALRLPDAAEPWQGQEHCQGGSLEAQPFRLLLIGESTVAGVGVSRQSEALCGQVAGQLATAMQRPVRWQACGRNGARAGDCLAASSVFASEPWDAVVLVLGVNDTTHLTPRWGWRRDMAKLIRRFRRRDCLVLVTAVPPLGRFTALPQPLRGWFGLRAGLLDADLRGVADAEGALHVPFGPALMPGMLALDGYHPSATGYRNWAKRVVERLRQAI